jgi:hypothetical protein
MTTKTPCACGAPEPCTDLQRDRYGIALMDNGFAPEGWVEIQKDDSPDIECATIFETDEDAARRVSSLARFIDDDERSCWVVPLDAAHEFFGLVDDELLPGFLQERQENERSLGTSGKRATFANAYGMTTTVDHAGEPIEPITRLTCPKCSETTIEITEAAVYSYADPQVLAGRLILGPRSTSYRGAGDFTCYCVACSHEWPLPKWVVVL